MKGLVRPVLEYGQYSLLLQGDIEKVQNKVLDL